MEIELTVIESWTEENIEHFHSFFMFNILIL